MIIKTSTTQTDGNRLVIDFYDNNNCLCARVGRVNYVKASTPLNEHSHPGMFELVYIAKGKQVYTLSEHNFDEKDFNTNFSEHTEHTGHTTHFNHNYIVNSGEMFVTLPGELHSSSNFPEDKSLLYYLIIDLYNDALNIGYDINDTNNLYNTIRNVTNRVFKATSSFKILFEALIENCSEDNCFRNTVIRNKLSEIIITIADCSIQDNDYNIHSTLKEAITYIGNNLHNDIRIDDLANLSGLSVSRFKSKFREQIGIPPREYVLRRKVDSAKVLLRTNDRSITEISYKLGFSTSQYFSTVFKRFEYISPTEYRKQFF